MKHSVHVGKAHEGCGTISQSLGRWDPEAPPVSREATSWGSVFEESRSRRPPRSLFCEKPEGKHSMEGDERTPVSGDPTLCLLFPVNLGSNHMTRLGGGPHCILNPEAKLTGQGAGMPCELPQ